MKSVAVGILVVSLVAGSAAIASAADSGRDGDRQEHHDGHDDQGHDDHGDGHDDHGHDDHGDGHDNPGHDNRGHYGEYHRPQGFHDHHWARGERLPKAYYGHQYVVANYHERGWRQPPRGYQWVRVDHDVVLAAVATGVVLDVLYNQF